MFFMRCLYYITAGQISSNSGVCFSHCWWSNPAGIWEDLRVVEWRNFTENSPRDHQSKMFQKILLLLMEDIRRSPVEVGSLSHYLQGFIHPRVVIARYLNHQQFQILFQTPARHKVVIPIGSMTVMRRSGRKRAANSPFHSAILPICHSCLCVDVNSRFPLVVSC